MGELDRQMDRTFVGVIARLTRRNVQANHPHEKGGEMPLRLGSHRKGFPWIAGARAFEPRTIQKNQGRFLGTLTGFLLVARN